MACSKQMLVFACAVDEHTSAVDIEAGSLRYFCRITDVAIRSYPSDVAYAIRCLCLVGCLAPTFYHRHEIVEVRGVGLPSRHVIHSSGLSDDACLVRCESEVFCQSEDPLARCHVEVVDKRE